MRWLQSRNKVIHGECKKKVLQKWTLKREKKRKLEKISQGDA
jgi:hypothetical protein